MTDHFEYMSDEDWAFEQACGDTDIERAEAQDDREQERLAAARRAALVNPYNDPDADLPPRLGVIWLEQDELGDWIEITPPERADDE